MLTNLLSLLSGTRRSRAIAHSLGRISGALDIGGQDPDRAEFSAMTADVAGYSRLMGEDVKASRDTGEDVHKSRILHGSVAVPGGALDKITACHRVDSALQCWN